MAKYIPSIEDAESYVRQNWVWCQGWSPRDGVFGRPMPRLGYPGEDSYDLAGACAGELQHRDSGCKNTTTAALSERQIKETALNLQALRAKRWEAGQPKRDKWAAANAYLGRCNMGMVEIGDDLAHVQRCSDGAVAVIELINGQWIARAPMAGEKIYT